MFPFTQRQFSAGATPGVGVQADSLTNINTAIKKHEDGTLVKNVVGLLLRVTFEHKALKASY